MIITMSENGTIINTVPENIYQGSNNANTIAVVSTIARTNQMMIAFKLPQVATYTTPVLMTLAENIDTQTGFNVWTYDIPSSVTEYYGTAEYQIQCITPNGIIIASGAGSFEIERGVPPILPDEPTPTIYQQILENIGSIQADVLNIQTDVEQNTTDIADLKTNAMLKNNFPNLVNYETYNTTTNTSDNDMNLTGEQIARNLSDNTTRMVQRRISNRDTSGITNGEQIIVSDTPSDSAIPTRQIEFDIGLNTSNEPVATIQFQENGVIVNNIDLLKIIADPTGYVTLGTEQIITGKKSFENVDYIELPINLNNYIRLNSLGLSYNTDVGAHYYNISAIGVEIPQSSGLTGAGQTRYGFIYSTNNDVAWENGDPYYWLADTQIHLNGDNIEYTLGSLNEGLGRYTQFSAGMVVCCDKDSASGTYKQGHMYRCDLSNSTYSMTDITPLNSSPIPSNVMITDDYPNLVDLENKIGVSGTETTGATTVSIRNSYLNYKNSLQLTPSNAKLNSLNGSRLMQLDISCGSTEGTDSAKILRSGGNDIDLLNLQPKLTAGTGITISEDNVISASGGSSSGGIQSAVVYGASNLFNELNNIIQNNQQTPLAIKWETRSEKTCNEVIGSLGASGTISLQQLDSQYIIGNNEILFLNIGSVGINEIYLTGNYQTNNFSLKVGSGLNTVGYISNSFSLSTQYSNGYFNYFDGEFDTTDDVFTIYYI